MPNRNYLQSRTRAIKRSPSGRFLCSAGLFPVSRSSFRSTDHLPPKKRAAKKNGSSFFVVCVPSLHTVASCVRRGYCVRNTNPQEKCGSVFASTAPYFFSGCSFAQPSGFAPLSLCIFSGDHVWISTIGGTNGIAMLNSLLAALE